jgi:hypothetical protein
MFLLTLLQRGKKIISDVAFLTYSFISVSAAKLVVSFKLVRNAFTGAWIAQSVYQLATGYSVEGLVIKCRWARFFSSPPFEAHQTV